MAILKSSSGIELNASHSTSTNFGSRTFNLCKQVSSGNADHITVSQTSAVSSYRRNMGFVAYSTQIRTSSPRTEIPARVWTGLIYLNTNGVATHPGMTLLGGGGNLISNLQVSDSGNSIKFYSTAASTGIYAGLYIVFYCDSFDKVSFTIH